MHYLLCPPSSSSSNRVNAVQSAAPPSLSSPATLEDCKEGSTVVAVHPAVQQWVGEGGAHGNHVKDGVEQAVVAQVQHRAVDVCGQLEGVERQPADGEHHHHGHQHLGGFAAAAVALRASAAAAGILCRADVAAQFGPDASVSEGNDGERQEVLQDQHGDAVNGAVCVFTRPLLCAHLGDRTKDMLDVVEFKEEVWVFFCTFSLIIKIFRIIYSVLQHYDEWCSPES